MILLHPDCLIFHTPGGDTFPCSAEMLTIELIGGHSAKVEPEVVREAAAAVAHYFRIELGQEHVTLDEFTEALSKALQRLGYDVILTDPALDELAVVAGSAELSPALDLRQVATSCGKGFELIFFQYLRTELRNLLKASPRVLRFHNLRSCVKQLAGRQRWCPHCEQLSDQIVDYVRECLSSESNEVGLVID